MAYATVMQFVNALDRNKAGLLVSEAAMIDERNAGGKKLVAAVKANLRAMACFTTAFTKASLLLLAYLVVEALKKKYMPDDQLSKVEARKSLNKVSMKSKEDPTDLIEKLRLLEAMYMESTMVTIDEDERITMMDKTRAE
jgi:chromate transport protein ChrA